MKKPGWLTALTGILLPALFCGQIFAQSLLVNYGSGAGSNVFNATQFPGWNVVTMSSTTIYTAGTGIAGTTLAGVPGDSSQYSNYTCISGPARDFQYGDRILITWHNSTGGDVNFNPLISFTDADNPVDAVGEFNWFIIGKLSDYYVFPGDTVVTIYDITNSQTSGPMVPASEGTWSRINICVNTIQPGIVLDKIRIGTADTTAPAIPAGLHVTGVTHKSVGLGWNSVTDNPGGDGLSHYEIWESGRLFGTVDSTVFSAFLLESGRNWQFQVCAVDFSGNKSGLSGIVSTSTSAYVADSNLLNPYTDLQYWGAFRMPEGGIGSDFGYMETDLAFFPGGDPGNGDPWPGSLFLAGNATDRFVAEICIPTPLSSPGKDVNDLNRGSFLQNFTDIRSPGQPVVEYSWSKGPALEYLPPQSGQTQGYLYTCFGDYYQWNGERLKSFGACGTDLSAASPTGGWFIGSETPYSQPYYMTFITFNFDMPAAVNGHLLVAGGSRPGDVHHGPTLVAYGPWNDGIPLPADNSHLDYSPLLMYDADAGSHRLEGFTYCDTWNGGAWLSANARQAVVISGSKGRGREWYGYDNGESTFNVMFNVPVPTEPQDHGPRQSCFDPMLMFYNPDDLLQVEAGSMQPWEPQPYAVLDLRDFLFCSAGTGPDFGSRFRGPGGMAYDRTNGWIYFLEQNVTGVDSSEALVHVFRLNPLAGVGEYGRQGEIRIFSAENTVRLVTDIPQRATVEIWDILGKCIWKSGKSEISDTRIELPLVHGMLVVRVKTDESATIRKVFLK